MKELIDKLTQAIEDQAVVCAMYRPDKESSYELGRVQGIYVGLYRALELLKAFLDDQEHEDQFK